MKAIDFISGAPKTFIFQQGSNKTNLGGILTVLFILAIIVIIFAYLYEYIANEKYVVSYYFILNYLITLNLKARKIL